MVLVMRYAIHEATDDTALGRFGSSVTVLDEKQGDSAIAFTTMSVTHSAYISSGSPAEYPSSIGGVRGFHNLCSPFRRRRCCT